MQPIILKPILLSICLIFVIHAEAQVKTKVKAKAATQSTAQTCDGSLGDPVINEDFGSGQGVGFPLPYSTTTLTYDPSGCPGGEGTYSIISSLTPYQNCRRDSWFSVLQDHTGNPNGYMMIINASEQPSIFFTQKANGLCPNTTYEFSAYILNLIMKSAVDMFGAPVYSEPDIQFSIETTSGQVLATYTSGTIQPTDQPTWGKYGVYFTTPADVSDVVVKMTNLAQGGYGNDLILDDITFRACGPVIEAGFGSVNGPVTEQVCVGSPTAFNIQTKIITNNTPSLQWQVNKDNTNWVDIPGATTGSLSVNPPSATPGTYQYRLGVANGSVITSAACRVYTGSLTVEVSALPLVPDIQPQTVCAGGEFSLMASGGATYQWSGPGIATSTQNPLIVNNVTLANSGTYSVVATSLNGCPAPPVKVAVTILPAVTATVSNDVTVCAGTPTQLSASGGIYYKWKPSAGLDHDDVANPVATPLQTTLYRVSVSNGACADSSQHVTVKVYQVPVADGGGNKTIYEGNSVKLNGTAKGDGIISTTWSPSTGLNDPSSLTPIASPTDNIIYTLTVISQNCGFSTSLVNVRVYKKITIPNTFTPNNDGINDNWNIKELSTYPDASVMIFDRYGKKVYDGLGNSKPWDGTYNGTQLNPGTYYYIIDLKDNAPKVAGWVLLVR